MGRVRFILREATASHHHRVDRAYAAFDLAGARSYGDFLSAHARVLPAVEDAVAAVAAAGGPFALWPEWRPRTPALLADLTALGRIVPTPAGTRESISEAEAWGMLYVLEGSRLGAALLARRVAPGLPVRYLSADHAAGGWQAFQVSLDAAAADGRWLDDAVRGAVCVFERFEQAAADACEFAS